MTENNAEQYVRLDGAIIDALYASQQGLDSGGNQNYDSYGEGGSRRKLGRKACEELARDWIGKRIVSLYPDEATRKWTDFTFDGKKKADLDKAEKKLITDFKAYEEKLDTRFRFNKTDKIANVYGGAALLLNIDDGRSPDQPVDRKNIKSIEGIYDLDGIDIQPDLSTNNPSDDPEFYRILVSSESEKKISQLGLNAAGYSKIHNSRVIRFDGSWLPSRVLRFTDGWGDPIIAACLKEIVGYEKVGNSMSEMLQDHTILLHKMKGLKALLQRATIDKTTSNQPNAQGIPQPLSVLSQQFRAMKLMMRLMKAVSVDSEDELTYLTRNYQGLPDMMDRFRDKLAAATGIPYTKLFGRGPGGLAAGGTGNTEEKVWADMVNNYQEANYRYKKLDRLYDYIWLAKDGPSGGKIPEHFSYHFLPLIQPSELEQAQIDQAIATARSTHASMLIQLQTSGDLTADEIRNSLFGDGEFSFDVKLDVKEWNKQKKLAQEQADAQSQQQQQQFGGGEQNNYFSGDQGEEQPVEEGQENLDSTLIDQIYMDACDRFVDLKAPFAQMWINDQKKRLLQK